MKIERELKVYYREQLENGSVRTHFDKVMNIIKYGAEDTPEGIVFYYDGRMSKPIAIEYNREWAYKAMAKKIRTYMDIDRFMLFFSDTFWDCRLQALCEKYAAGRTEATSC